MASAKKIAKRLEKLLEMEQGDYGWERRYSKVLASINALQSSAQDATYICERQEKLLDQIANAVRGTPPSALRGWPHHDLPKLVEDVIVQRDGYKAGLASLIDKAAAQVEAAEAKETTALPPHPDLVVDSEEGIPNPVDALVLDLAELFRRLQDRVTFDDAPWVMQRCGTLITQVQGLRKYLKRPITELPPEGTPPCDQVSSPAST